MGNLNVSTTSTLGNKYWSEDFTKPLEGNEGQSKQSVHYADLLVARPVNRFRIISATQRTIERRQFRNGAGKTFAALRKCGGEMAGAIRTVNQDLTKSHAEYAIARRGIRSPEVVTLDTGQVVFRFASTKIFKNGELFPSDSNRWASGPWWVLEEDYRKIVTRFLQGKLSLGTVARSAVAVQPSWSLMDVSIKAYLIDDMKVFTGAGSTQYHDMMPNGMRMTLTGWSDIQQIYVPNMRGQAKQNIRVKRQKVISSHSFGW